MLDLSTSVYIITCRYSLSLQNIRTRKGTFNNHTSRKILTTGFKSFNNICSYYIYKHEYSQARDVFDKNLRRTERTYKKARTVDIETMVTTNPNEFWEKIRKLGPRKVKDIPMEVVDEFCEIVTNEQDALHKWRIDFENLYNGKNNTEFENDHYNQSKVHKQLLESEMEDPLFMPNEDLLTEI